MQYPAEEAEMYLSQHGKSQRLKEVPPFWMYMMCDSNHICYFLSIFVRTPTRMSNISTLSTISTINILEKCFTDLSGVQALTYRQVNEYTTGWTTFQRVEVYNSQVSTMRANGDMSATYWKFETNQGLTNYRLGAVLWATYAGYSTIVQKN